MSASARGNMIVRAQDRVLVMGITGKQGTFWTERMQAYGTAIIGGTNPGKAGTLHCGVPVEARYYAGGIHAFHAMVWNPAARRCWRDALAFLDRHMR